MGKRTEWRTTPLPAGWETMRKAQLAADGYMCTAIRGDTGLRCRARATDVHHMGGNTDHDSLTSLCAHHHLRITGAQGGAAVRKKQARPPASHPGLR